MTARADLYREAIAHDRRMAQRLTTALDALEFYALGKHFDTVHVDGDPEDVKRTRILDTGSVAEEALKVILDVTFF